MMDLPRRALLLIDGIKVVDDKTITFTAKSPMALTTFENTYGRYIHTLPKHVLADYSDEELMTLDWFNHPDGVISGPYFLTDDDTDHYVSYEANALGTRKGAPKIGKLNLKIVEGSQTYSGLQSGEIDIAHHTMTAIPQEDYESIESLDNVKAVYGLPITNQLRIYPDRKHSGCESTSGTSVCHRPEPARRAAAEGTWRGRRRLPLFRKPVL